jgi:hypothetical protein
MDQIFFVNSASFVDVSITSSLIADLGSNIDFSLATQVSGSFVGSLIGNASTATTASYSLVTGTAISASHANVADTTLSASHANTSDTSVSASHSVISDTAISASFATQAQTAVSSSYALTATSASYVVGQRIKSGIVSGSQFTGNPQTFSVVFSVPFPSVLYSISIVGDSARSWLVDNRSVSGFTINANTKTTVTGFVYWQAIAAGEFNS